MLFRSDVAGPQIEYDPDAGFTAALFTARACWFAVSRDELPEQVTKLLPTIPNPTTPAAHLSIDLTLRYLVTVHRRVRSQNTEDVLAVRLGDTFRRCPLTGALSDLADAPTGDRLFGGHVGLELLYAERLVANFRSPWLPPEGRGRERVEVVFEQLGKKLPDD